MIKSLWPFTIQVIEEIKRIGVSIHRSEEHEEFEVKITFRKY